MTRTVVVAAMVHLLSALMGCTTRTTITLQSTVDLAEATPFTRLMTFARVHHGRFHHVYPGFKVALIKELKACGIESVVVDAADRRDREHVFDRWVARFRPTVVLTIEVEDSAMTKIPNIPDTLRFSLKTHDIMLGHVTWMAEVVLRLGRGRSYDPLEIGERFATRIIEQLQADHVLHHCTLVDPGAR